MIFSGAQPSGRTLHLGNYLGAVSKWVDLQHSERCIFCVVDLHALTSSKGADLDLQSTSLVASYIACGIDPEKAILFLQSAVPEHLELAWILSCITPVGWLNRMTQFKDKSRSGGLASMGLYCYPALMASDILLYKASKVPVGDDQQQHIELTQDIARAFNHTYGVDYFQEPQALIFEGSSRIMSLKDGKKKMSKSDISDLSRINLDDSDDLIAKKIQKAATDGIFGFSPESLEGRAEINNLINIFASLAGSTKEVVCCRFAESSTQEFKGALTDLLIQKISPIRAKIKELSSDSAYVSKVLSSGNEAAREIASSHIKEIRKIVGLRARV